MKPEKPVPYKVEGRREKYMALLAAGKLPVEAVSVLEGLLQEEEAAITAYEEMVWRLKWEVEPLGIEKTLTLGQTLDLVEAARRATDANHARIVVDTNYASLEARADSLNAFADELMRHPRWLPKSGPN